MSFDVLGDVNYLAALVAAVAYFAFGALWYSPMVLAKPWMKAIGMDPERAGSQSPGPMLFIGTAIAYFVMAVVLAAIARSMPGATDVVDGLVLGILIGVGIGASQIWVNAAYEQRPAALFWINGANVILGYTLMAVIVTVWD
ncbi:MAG TPA: DUF1761 domain-containing protein [Actinomycetota bacterium]|jgi:uncharacterized membrane protein required for colicin V production|nr:DUF1761 domain-containing protein [Actinomycetota bacterium]